MKHWARLDSPKFTLAIVVIAYAVFLDLRLSKNDHDFSAFVTAGDLYVNPATAPDNLRILRDSAGYDGQFYYRLALTPFTSERSDLGITLDYPAYRQQRIVYPLLAWGLSLGQPGLVPVSLLVVNFLALCAIAWLGSKYAQMVQLHAIWGLAFALFAGFLLALSRDTAEIAEIGFLLGSAVCLRQNRQVLAAALLALAVLTKETALVTAFGILIALAIRQKRTRSRTLWFPAITPILAYVLWQSWLNHIWNSTSVTETTVSANIGMPLVGLSHFVQSILPVGGHLQLVWLIELLLAATFMMAVMWALHQSEAPRLIKASWLLYVALMLSLTQAVWVEDWAFLRVLSEFYLLGIMILLESESRLRKLVFCESTVSWLLLGIDVVKMR